MRGLAARMPPRSLLLVSFLAAADALVVGASGRGSPRTAPINMQEGMWNSGLDYGKGLFRFYVGFDEFMKPFPDEDREEYPEMFKLPDGCYEVSLGDIGRKLDHWEKAASGAMQGDGGNSNNVRADGYFGIQVISKALEIN